MTMQRHGTTPGCLPAGEKAGNFAGYAKLGAKADWSEYFSAS